MYDLEIIVPVCGTYLSRIEDFKKYGLVNVGARRILLNLIVSGGEVIQDLEKGWPEGVDINEVVNKDPDFVKNTYSFFSSMQPDKIKSRWIMKMDDDSCTDINGLLENIDEFYDWEMPFYLAADLQRVRGGKEDEIFHQYAPWLQKHQKIAWELMHEIECSVISNFAMKKILSGDSGNLMKKRCEFEGGATDCALAFAAAMAKIYPINCPFLTYLPLVEDLSLVGGIKNHIHLICRSNEGENFDCRVTTDKFDLLNKIVKGELTDLENSILGKRYMNETDRYIRIYEFVENYRVNCKFDHRRLMWFEKNGVILVMDGQQIAFTLSIKGSDLIGENIDAEEEWEKVVVLKFIGKVNKPIPLG